MSGSSLRVWAESMACVPVHTWRPETASRVTSVCSWGVSRIHHSAWVSRETAPSSSRLLPSTPPHPTPAVIGLRRLKLIGNEREGSHLENTGYRDGCGGGLRGFVSWAGLLPAEGQCDERAMKSELSGQPLLQTGSRFRKRKGQTAAVTSVCTLHICLPQPRPSRESPWRNTAPRAPPGPQIPEYQLGV